MIRPATLFPLLLVICPALAWPGDPSDTRSRSEKSATYSAGLNGELVIVPIEIGEQRFAFAVDTGAALCVIDSGALKRASHLRKSSNDNPFGFSETVELHLTLADTDFSAKCDAGVSDLSEIQRLTGHQVHGLLGTNFLKEFAVTLDSDLGIVTFERQLSRPRGVKIPSTCDRYGRLFVNVAFSDQVSAEFLVDTGMFVPGLGEMKNSLFQKLANANAVAMIGGKSQVTSLAGVLTGRKGQLEFVKLQSFEHDRIGIREGEINALGLDYLSRFAVSLDFASQTVYLRPGKRFGAKTPFDMSGMFVSRQGASTIVEKVQPGTPAQLAGLQKSDRITKINDHAADALTPLEIRRILAGPEGTDVRLEFDRLIDSRTASFRLENWQHVDFEGQEARSRAR